MEVLLPLPLPTHLLRVRRPDEALLRFMSRGYCFIAWRSVTIKGLRGACGKGWARLHGMEQRWEATIITMSCKCTSARVQMVFTLSQRRYLAVFSPGPFCYSCSEV